jgi:sialic acid synthase SpsE
MTLAAALARWSPSGDRLGQPIVIAEAGVNHEGSMKIAQHLIEQAAEGGADVIKFQSYKAETLASRDSPAYWDTTKETTTSQYELFRKHDSFWKAEFEALRRHCDDVGIEFMSTPFDLESARFLDDLQGVFKIASADLTNRPFIEAICRYGKPILLSTGASTLGEIADSTEVIRRAGLPFGLMHCVLNYPTSEYDANLGMIGDLRRRFPEALPGYSDHTEPDSGMTVLTTAVLMGARVLEKHFTHDRTLPGNDHYHAMDLDGLRTFRATMDRLERIIGSPSKAPLESEEIARQNARRSLVAARDIEAGATITEDDLTWKRPGTGISPRLIDDVLGRRARRAIRSDTVLDWSDLD